jgi:hypothetical protein
MAGLLGSGARVRVAAWGCAGCRYCGVTALATLSQAVEAVHARSALARCLVPGQSCSPASNAGSLASSVSWSAYRAKVPGQDVLRTAIRGRGHVLRSRPRAAALRRARLPRRREGLFLCVERALVHFRTGGNDDDERPINGHTAAHPATASELCINGNVGCGRKITWGPGLRACKVPNFGEGMALLPPGIPHAAVPWR